MCVCILFCFEGLLWSRRPIISPHLIRLALLLFTPFSHSILPPFSSVYVFPPSTASLISLCVPVLYALSLPITP